MLGFDPTYKRLDIRDLDTFATSELLGTLVDRGLKFAPLCRVREQVCSKLLLHVWWEFFERMKRFFECGCCCHQVILPRNGPESDPRECH